MLELYFVYVYNNLWMQFESIAANINANIFLLQMKQKTFVHEQSVEGIVNMKISGKMFLSYLLFWLGTGKAEKSVYETHIPGCNLKSTDFSSTEFWLAERKLAIGQPLKSMSICEELEKCRVIKAPINYSFLNELEFHTMEKI